MATTSQHEPFNFATRGVLARTIRELNLDIPLSDDVGILLTPSEIAGRRVPNRFAVQPMEGHDAQPDGGPGLLTFRRYRRFAAGGSGLIWFEATAVMPEGRGDPTQLYLHEANVSAFRRLVDKTRAAARAAFGNEHEPFLVLQLTHSGRYARPGGTARPVIGHHSPVLDPLTGISPLQPPVSDEELDRILEAHVRAAKLAAQAGFDAVDVKACHGYLVAELLGAHTRANSRYGGGFENRTRFLLDAVIRIRDSVPDLLVTSRFSAYDGVPYPYGFAADPMEPDRENLNEPLELARRLRDAGCRFLNVSIGEPCYVPHCGRPFDKPLAGGPYPNEHPLVGIARLLRITAAVQRAVPDVPVVGSGYSWLRQYVPNVGAAVVRAGNVAFVGLGRGAIAYPDCVRDLMERGAFDPDKTCITCSSCSQIMGDGGHAGCVVRDAEIYAEQYREGRRRGTAPREALGNAGEPR